MKVVHKSDTPVDVPDSAIDHRITWDSKKGKYVFKTHICADCGTSFRWDEDCLSRIVLPSWKDLSRMSMSELNLIDDNELICSDCSAKIPKDNISDLQKPYEPNETPY